MLGSDSPEGWLTNLSVASALCGVFFFFYGMLASHPALYSFILATRASLLGDVDADIAAIMAHGAASPPISGVLSSQAFFMTASALVVFGAVIDVWQKLKKLEGRN